MSMRSLGGVRLSATLAPRRVADSSRIAASSPRGMVCGSRRIAVSTLIVVAGFIAALLPCACMASAADANPADPPQVGAAAPPFRLQDQDGVWHTLSEYRGKWLVLYFYPKDDTPGCTTQACEFRDNIFEFRRLGAVIVGISVDDVASHKDFAAEHSLPFTLLADSTKRTAQAYGVLHTAFGIMDLASRETFIIDPQGRIAKHYAPVEPKGHSQVVLNDLEMLERRAQPGA
jgi:peroxiredoxin Q/BCP